MNLSFSFTDCAFIASRLESGVLMVLDTGDGETTPANWCLAPSASLALGHEVPAKKLNTTQNAVGFELLMAS